MKTESREEADTEQKGQKLHKFSIIKLPMRRAYKKHIISPDRLYQDVQVSQFINKVMKKGKKTTAQKIVYGAFDVIKEKTQKEPLEIFKKAMENVSPLLEVKPKRIGGATYQVPMEVRSERKFHLATKWILDASRSKKGKGMAVKLSEELLAASNNEGSAMKKKNDTHRMAEANKAFAHFARQR